MLIPFAGDLGVLGCFFQEVLAISVVVRQYLSLWKEIVLYPRNQAQSCKLIAYILLQPHTVFPCGQVLAEREQPPINISKLSWFMPWYREICSHYITVILAREHGFLCRIKTFVHSFTSDLLK